MECRRGGLQRSCESLARQRRCPVGTWLSLCRQEQNRRSAADLQQAPITQRIVRFRAARGDKQTQGRVGTLVVSCLQNRHSDLVSRLSYSISSEWDTSLAISV